MDSDAPALEVFQSGTSSAMHSVLCLPVFSVMVVATVVLFSWPGFYENADVSKNVSYSQ